jgi:hypothetical protein
MRHGFAFAALLRPLALLPLAGCVVAPPPGPPPYAAYPPPGYPPAVVQTDPGYPGYAYNNGSPTLYVEGVTWPLIYFGGGWGYWDGYHHWHRAPDAVWRHLNGLHPGGAGYRPWGGGPYGRPEGPRAGYPGGPRGYGPPAGPGPRGQPGGMRPAAAGRQGGPQAEGRRGEERR